MGSAGCCFLRPPYYSADKVEFLRAVLDHGHRTIFANSGYTTSKESRDEYINVKEYQPKSAGAGVRDPKDTPTLVHAFFGGLVRLLSPNVVKDMELVVEKVRGSDLDWTVVRVPMLTEDPATGRIREGYVGKAIGPRLSRADMADYLLRQVESKTYLGQAPAISN